MINIADLKTRKEELERSLRGLEYLPAVERQRSVLDLEAYKELIAIREATNNDAGKQPIKEGV